MAVTMSDGPIRKACDRCHRQKLSCKRVADEACERCIRLKEECTSSPSLRYQKQHLQQQQQHQHQHQHQHQYHSSSTSRDHVRRQAVPSPKRQRTDGGSPFAHHADLSIVKTQSVGSICDNAAFEDNAVVSPDAMLDMVDFDFGFGHSAALYQPGPSQGHHQHQHQLQQQQQPVPQTFTGNMDGLMTDHGEAIVHSWSPVHSVTSESAFTSPMAPEIGQVGSGIYPRSPSSRRHIPKPSKPHGSTTPQRKSKKRIARHRARQITLRPYAGGQGSSPEGWMARITEVNSRLLQLSSDLPFQAESQSQSQSPEEPGRPSSSMVSTPEDDEDGGGPSLCTTTTTPFPIDDMFQLSRHFADLLAEMSPPVTEAVGSPASDDGASQQLARRLNSMSDPATCLLVLSTYVRLLDMYQKVFRCIHSELGQLGQLSTATTTTTTTTRNPLFQSWKLPGVTVGSFTVDSTPSLQMSLTIQLAEEFLLQMRRAAASLDPALRADGSGGPPASSGKAAVLDAAASMFSGVVDVSFQALKRQEESLGRELRDLRKAMEVFLDG